MTTRDHDLLDVLAASLGPPPKVEPSWPEISHLHRVIDTRGRGWGGQTRTPFWRVRRPLTAALAGFIVLGGASAAAAASGAVMPQPVRVAARAVGLPIDSPSLAGAKAALARLRGALGHTPRDTNAVRADAEDVRDRLAKLSADDRSQVEDESAFLLAAADAALTPPPVLLGSPPSAPSNAAPAPVAPADDHRGGPGSAAEPENSGTGSNDGHSGDDHSGSSATPAGSDTSGGPGQSGSSGDNHTATTIHADNSGHGSSGGGGSDGGGSGVQGGPENGGSSGSDGGGHSGPG